MSDARTTFVEILKSERPLQIFKLINKKGQILKPYMQSTKIYKLDG